MLIDTVGMSTLLLPDLQYHFHDMNPNWVVNHAYNVASYILEHDNPIQDGETIDGVADGQMCREIQWKCQYEDALIQPPREVLDICMGRICCRETVRDEWNYNCNGHFADFHDDTSAFEKKLAWITCIFLCSVSDIWYRTSYMIPEMRLCLHGPKYPFSKFIQEVYIS